MDLIWFGAEILWLLVNDDRQTCARFLKLQRSPRTLQLLINLQVICCKACVCTRKYIGVAATDLNTDLWDAEFLSNAAIWESALCNIFM